jgi:hypothetical protein
MYPTLLYCPEVEGELTNLDFFFVGDWRVGNLMFPLRVNGNGEMEVLSPLSHLIFSVFLFFGSQ